MLLVFIWQPSCAAWRAFSGESLDGLTAIASLPPVKAVKPCREIAAALGFALDTSQVSVGLLVGKRPAAIAPPKFEAVTMGFDSPRRGPADPAEWAAWYKANPAPYLAPGFYGPVSMSPAEQHAEALKALPPLKWFVEMGKSLRAQRKARGKR